MQVCVCTCVSVYNNTDNKKCMNKKSSATCLLLTVQLKSSAIPKPQVFPACENKQVNLPDRREAKSVCEDRLTVQVQRNRKRVIQAPF